jgi:hypothetical protein
MKKRKNKVILLFERYLVFFSPALLLHSCFKSNQNKSLKNFDQVNLVANTRAWSSLH